MTVASRIGLLLVVTLPIMVLDQVTKALARAFLSSGDAIVVLPFMNLRLSFNRGISFGFLPADGEWGVRALIGITALIAVGLAIWSVRTRNRHEGAALSLIVSGAVGNLIDRVKDRMVTDFIDLHVADYHWPTFNVADIAITVGATWLVADSFGIGARRRREAA
ncbi:signal peptidase II [Microvirga sp. ACRRW]|uniref:signal peptidase II n=1 Tax=Microvirga sp. ACRRW TaxID=2918205 RepID=UPI001EF557A5|nr:signal peptidase II [Microvirga sp. ACRRW]MCG7392910.1 signal peptidase II [Microvirga sp. ACRRW]